MFVPVAASAQYSNDAIQGALHVKSMFSKDAHLMPGDSTIRHTWPKLDGRLRSLSNFVADRKQRLENQTKAKSQADDSGGFTGG